MVEKTCSNNLFQILPFTLKSCQQEEIGKVFIPEFENTITCKVGPTKYLLKTLHFKN